MNLGMLIVNSSQGTEDPIGQIADRLRDVDSDGLDDQLLHSTIRGLLGVAQQWASTGDDQPYLNQFRQFGISAMSRLTEDLTTIQGLHSRLPVNRQDESELDITATLDIINYGIPLIWAPSWQVVEALLRSPQREFGALLSHRRHVISEDCVKTLAQVTEPGLSAHVKMAINAAIDLSTGDPRATQALAANILETWLRDASGREFFSHLTGVTPTNLLRLLFVLTPVAVAFGMHDFQDLPPDRFNRYATAFNVGPEQYTTANAVVSVMLISSVLREAQQSGWAR
jgi:hypothetical protein